LTWKIEEASQRILKLLADMKGKTSLSEICEKLKLDPSPAMRTLLTLQEQGLLKTSEKLKSFFRLTPEGESYASKGLPERRLVEAVVRLGGTASLEEALKEAHLTREAGNIALGWIVRKGWGKIRREKGETLVEASHTPSEGKDETLLRLMAEKGEADSQWLEAQDLLDTALELKRRNLIEEKVKRFRDVELTEAGWRQAEEIRVEAPKKPVVTVLTGELIRSGKWREVEFRRYDVSAAPPTLYPGKKHFYLEFLEEVRDILVAMGFEEVWGPYVETEFWNFDVLFQPQDHPAREIHDSYQLKHPRFGRLPSRSLALRVGKTHKDGWKTGSKGWKYEWNPEVARRLVMRSQTTAVSVRQLSARQNPPVKVFCLSRVFRPDVLDAKHSMEFHQCDGIMGDWGLNLRHLLGFFEEFCGALGFKEVKFRPGYFPFTEPSVEVFVKHPTLGWVEVAGSGVFRPEVTLPLGARFPVLAWGAGIGRLAMVKLGISDIRELHTRNLELLREAEV
jgi:phenylalanyl-tRNA synthetase alpha chain